MIEHDCFFEKKNRKIIGNNGGGGGTQDSLKVNCLQTKTPHRQITNTFQGSLEALPAGFFDATTKLTKMYEWTGLMRPGFMC